MPKKELFLDPITRIEGHLGVRVIVDENTGAIDPDSVRAFTTMYSGFEVFLRGRPPEDAIHITSRICGVCGASHANAATVANDMAYGVSPTPLGIALRNMAFAMTDHIYDQSLILNMLGGPDYSEMVVSKMTPSVWEEAKKYDDLTFVDIHGYKTIADIMKDLNPITGKIWKLTVKYQRIAREAGVLIYGRHAHPSTLIPGGISTDLTNADYLFTAYLGRLVHLTAWIKFITAIWHDLWKFFTYAVGLPDGREYEFERPSWKNVPKDSYIYSGLTYYEPILVSAGLFDEPEGPYVECGAYKSAEDFYACMDNVARERLIPLAMIYKGEAVSQNYSDINVSEIEHPMHTFFEDWKGKQPVLADKDPRGTPIHYGKFDVAYHPWNMMVILAPQKLSWDGKYTWITHIRKIWPKVFEISPYEVGPYARMYVLAYVGKKLENIAGAGFEAGGGKIKVWLPRSASTVAMGDLPAGTWSEVEMEFEIPPFSSTINRVYTRAVSLAVVTVAAWYNLIKAMTLYKKAKEGGQAIQTSRDWRGRGMGRRTLGCGFLEAPRGMVAHWLVQENQKLLNYQVHAPTTPNASPRGDKICTAGYDASKPGKEGECVSPYEMSVIKTVITEETKPEMWAGLDIARAVRSFDPCMACAAHVQIGRSRLVKKIRMLLAPVGFTTY